MDNIGIDMNQFAQQMEDYVVTKVMSDLAPDEKSKKLITDVANIFINNGVPAITAMKIMNDLAEYSKNLNKGETNHEKD